MTASNDRTARVWDAATGVTLTAFRGHRLGVYAAALSPDGSLVATAGLDGDGADLPLPRLRIAGRDQRPRARAAGPGMKA